MVRARREDGQILVIFAGGLIAILLISALVIDLGFVFMIRRAEQNAADAGAVAAARYIRTGTGLTPEPAKMRQAACFYAQKNGFFAKAAGNVDGCTPANDDFGTVLTVNYPPGPGSGQYAAQTGYVQVGLSRDHHSFLAGIAGIQNIGITSAAVAAYTNGDSNSSSLIALDPSDTCSTLKTHGNGNINIHPVVPGTLGGYIHVNGTCSTGAPNGSCSTSGLGALNIAGNGTVTAPATYVAGTCKRSGNLASVLTEGAVQIGDPLLELPPPPFGNPNPGAECGIGTAVFTTPGGTGCRFQGTGSGKTFTLDPGVYYGGWDINSKVTLVLHPGIYVIAGGGVRLAALSSITSVEGASGIPAPVLVYNTDDPSTGAGQADLDFTAQTTLKLRAIDTGPYQGILVWNDGAGSNPGALVTLGGQTTLDIAGTVYSPQGLVKMEGGTGVGSTAAVQIIAWQVDVGGGSTLDMPYDPSKLYHFPSKGLVH
jgi:hypothetical protein